MLPAWLLPLLFGVGVAGLVYRTRRVDGPRCTLTDDDRAKIQRTLDSDEAALLAGTQGATRADVVQTLRTAATLLASQDCAGSAALLEEKARRIELGLGR